MIGRSKTLAIVLTMVVFAFCFGIKPILPAANATYVEGYITQDTIWTLVDSPFVLSNDVTILPDVTLTIDPSVEVRFAEGLSLIVEGNLVANGAQDQTIRFTSNKAAPQPGDWNTINVTGAQASVLMTHCNIDYGANGLTVKGGSLDLQKSTVNLNLVGIFLDGSDQVVIHENSIEANDRGIVLSGDLSSGIDIQRNKIELNRQMGISFEAGVYDGAIILNNSVSQNYYGFFVSSITATSITRHYISDNNIGILYAQGVNHEAHFNDIFGNNVGADALSTAAANVSHNFWGDESGPYHDSLNPYGKGNPVRGNLVNLDFIYPLTSSIDNSNTPPTAKLWPDKTVVASGQSVTFIGSGSSDDGRIDQYFFDFGDGNSSGWTTLSLFSHDYATSGNYLARLRVLDDFGVISSDDTITMSVQSLQSLETTVALSHDTINYNEEVSITVYVTDGVTAIENASVTMLSTKGGSFTPVSGLTNSTGYFITTFTTPIVAETADLRIYARTNAAGYADGADYQHLSVIPPLTVEVTAEPATVQSEGTTTVTIYVTGEFEQPIENALLTLSSNYGDLSSTTGMTNAEGNAVFTLTTPSTLNQIDIIISSTATKSGYAEGFGQGTVVVEPKMLVLEATAEPIDVISEAKVNVTAHVSYNMMPIQDANVTIMSDTGGNFSNSAKITDSHGFATFIFTAPPVATQTNVTITLQAVKTGYVAGQSSLEIAVSQGILEVRVNATSSTIMSTTSTVITVNVTSNGAPVADAEVAVSADEGNFSNTAGLTDDNGICTFFFTAPRTAVPTSVVVAANVTKSGYASASDQTTIIVTEEVVEGEGGWPLTTILLIIIPVVIAIAIVVLIKLGIIVISPEEE